MNNRFFLRAILYCMVILSTNTSAKEPSVLKTYDFRYVFAPVCKQASFICDGHLVCLSNNGHAKAYPLFSTADSVEFDLACASQKPHCNVANLVRSKKQNYLYTSEWSGKRRCFVENIGLDTKSRKWHTRLVQTFSFHMPDSVSGAGHSDWAVDASRRKLYLYTYKENGPYHDETASAVIIIEFRLPGLAEGNVTFTEQDILRRTEIPMLQGMQDSEIRKGKMYITAGNKTNKRVNWEGRRRLVIFNLKRFQTEKIVDISAYFDEPEGIDFWHGTLPNGDKGTHMLITYRRNMYKISLP